MSYSTIESPQMPLPPIRQATTLPMLKFACCACLIFTASPPWNTTQGVHIALQVYFTTYEKLKAQMKKREGMPQPIQHMVSAVGAGDSTCHFTAIKFCSFFHILFRLSEAHMVQYVSTALYGLQPCADDSWASVACVCSIQLPAGKLATCSDSTIE